MATKSKKPATAVATRKSSVPVSADLMAKIQADIAEQAAMVVPSNSNRIRLNSDSGKKYVFPDKSEVTEFVGIVVDFATVQVLYAGPYVAGQINQIVCYASATKPADLAPLPEVITPQAADCKSCLKSKFGADGSKPECGLRKQLAIMMPGVEELLILDLPVLAAKQFDKYAQSVLVATSKTVYMVETTFSFDQSVKFDSPRFENTLELGGDEVSLVVSRREEARRMLLAAPNFSPVEEKLKGKAAALAAPKKRAK